MYLVGHASFHAYRLTLAKRPHSLLLHLGQQLAPVVNPEGVDLPALEDTLSPAYTPARNVNIRPHDQIIPSLDVSKGMCDSSQETVTPLPLEQVCCLNGRMLT
jgi:hypothetical protein